MESLNINFDISKLKSFSVIQSLWKEIGLTRDKELLEKRTHILLNNFEQLLDTILEDEVKMVRDLKDNIRNFTVEVSHLCSQLTTSLPEELSNEELTPLQRESALRKFVDHLRQVTQERTMRQIKLQELEISLCKELGEEPTFTQGLHVASSQNPKFLIKEDQLLEFKTQVTMLEDKLKRFIKTFNSYREKIISLWLSTGKEPNNQFEKYIYDYDTNNICLNLDTIERSKELANQLAETYENIKRATFITNNEVISLWKRLEIDKDYCDRISSQCNTISAKSLNIWLEEKEILLMKKRENLARFIQNTKNLILEVWDRCYFGPSQRYEACPLFFSTLQAEDGVLESLEETLDFVQQHERKYDKLYRLVDKREVAWQKLILLDENMNNPDRLNNRGGGLLKEARERSSLEKKIPKMEEKLRDLILDYSKNEDCRFYVNDVIYQETMDSQWITKKCSNKQQKVIRQQAKVEKTINEMQFGHTPTPKKINFKRPRPLITPIKEFLPKIHKIAPNFSGVKTTNSPRKVFTHSSLSRTKNIRKRMSIVKLRRDASLRKQILPSNISPTNSTKSLESKELNLLDKLDEEIEHAPCESNSSLDLCSNSYHQFITGVNLNMRSSHIPISNPTTTINHLC